jgi:hypothetical protein
MTTFSDGLFQYGGEPVGSVRYTSPWADHWFVDGTTGGGSNAYDGKAPNRAFATLTYALTKAGKEDVIYVRTKGAKDDASDYYYYEDGAQITVPYASENLAIVGVTPHRSKSYHGVWFQHGANDGETGYVLLNYAPGLSLEGVNFSAKDYIRTSYGAVHMYSSATGGAYTTHAGSVAFSCYNCFFRDGQLNIWGGYDGVVNNCTFEASGSANSGVWSTSNTLPTGGHRIMHSHFNEMFADNQTLRYIYFVAGAQKNVMIHDCWFGLVPADNHYMWFGGSVTGLVTDCHFQNADITKGANDANSELYSADGGVVFAQIFDGSGTYPGSD